MIKQQLQWMLTAILICGASVFTACTVDNIDNPVKPEQSKVIDLATLTEAYTVQDGETLTGTLAKEVQINVADGAHITIKDVSINAASEVYKDGPLAGIYCLGDATITLSGDNIIRSFDNFYPAIFVPENHTLTIQGDGSLDVKSSGTITPMSAAIGSVRAGATCGNLVFLGGKIIAEGGYDSAAIGASYSSVCGNITIGGTAEITVMAAKSGAAIGTGTGPYESMSICGDITIGGQAKVDATGVPAIGPYCFAQCGNINIGEDAHVVAKGIYYAPGIGCGSSYTLCKGINISGGTVIASCDKWGPGIGTSGDKAKCESINITGGTILAVGGEDGPGIGSGPDSTIGIPIVITSGATEITAVRGSDLADYIGTGDLGTRGSVTIDGVENATPESTFTHFDTSVIGNRWTILNKNANIIDNLSEKIIGKWILAEKSGKPAPTNLKAVFTFKSSSEATGSISIESRGVHSPIWSDGNAFGVSINGNVVTLTEKGGSEGVTAKEEFDMKSISATEFTANRTTGVYENGEKKVDFNEDVKFIKLTADYSTVIISTWECEGLTGGETYNDANARLVFLADGTYRYYRKNDAGQWEAVTTREYQKYFVDGTLLATCWKNEGEDELREWWEIASISDSQMLWTALRHKADGTAFSQEMKWKRITF